MGFGSGSGNATATVDDRKSENQSPLWGYVTKLEKKVGTGGTWNYQCHFYGEIHIYIKLHQYIKCRTRPYNFKIVVSCPRSRTRICSRTRLRAT